MITYLYMATKTKIPTTVKTRGNRLTESTRKRYYVQDPRKNYTYKYGDKREYYRRKPKPVEKMVNTSSALSINCGRLAVVIAALKVIVPLAVLVYSICVGGGIKLFATIMMTCSLAFGVFAGIILIFLAAGAAGSSKSKQAVWSLIVGYLADSIVYIVSAIILANMNYAANGGASF